MFLCVTMFGHVMCGCGLVGKGMRESRLRSANKSSRGCCALSVRRGARLRMARWLVRRGAVLRTVVKDCRLLFI